MGFSKCRFARDGSLDFFTAVNVGGVGWVLHWRQDELGELTYRSACQGATMYTSLYLRLRHSSGQSCSWCQHLQTLLSGLTEPYVRPIAWRLIQRQKPTKNWQLRYGFTCAAGGRSGGDRALEISTSGGVLGAGTSEGEAIAVSTPGLSTVQRVKDAHMVFVTAADSGARWQCIAHRCADPHSGPHPCTLTLSHDLERTPRDISSPLFGPLLQIP